MTSETRFEPNDLNSIIGWYLTGKVTLHQLCVALNARLDEKAALAAPVQAEVGAGVESPDKLTMASITCPDCKAIHPVGGCTDYLREKRLARSEAARPDVAPHECPTGDHDDCTPMIVKD